MNIKSIKIYRSASRTKHRIRETAAAVRGLFSGKCQCLMRKCGISSLQTAVLALSLKAFHSNKKKSVFEVPSSLWLLQCFWAAVIGTRKTLAAAPTAGVAVACLAG